MQKILNKLLCLDLAAVMAVMSVPFTSIAEEVGKPLDIVETENMDAQVKFTYYMEKLCEAVDMFSYEQLCNADFGFNQDMVADYEDDFYTDWDDSRDVYEELQRVFQSSFKTNHVTYSDVDNYYSTLVNYRQAMSDEYISLTDCPLNSNSLAILYISITDAETGEIIGSYSEVPYYFNKPSDLEGYLPKEWGIKLLGKKVGDSITIENAKVQDVRNSLYTTCSDFWKENECVNVFISVQGCYFPTTSYLNFQDENYLWYNDEKLEAFYQMDKLIHSSNWTHFARIISDNCALKKAFSDGVDVQTWESMYYAYKAIDAYFESITDNKVAAINKTIGTNFDENMTSEEIEKDVEYQKKIYKKAYQLQAQLFFEKYLIGYYLNKDNCGVDIDTLYDTCSDCWVESMNRFSGTFDASNYDFDVNAIDKFAFIEALLLFPAMDVDMKPEVTALSDACIKVEDVDVYRDYEPTKYTEYTTRTYPSFMLTMALNPIDETYINLHGDSQTSYVSEEYLPWKEYLESEGFTIIYDDSVPFLAGTYDETELSNFANYEKVDFDVNKIIDGDYESHVVQGDLNLNDDQKLIDLAGEVMSYYETILTGTNDWCGVHLLTNGAMDLPCGLDILWQINRTDYNFVDVALVPDVQLDSSEWDNISQAILEKMFTSETDASYAYDLVTGIMSEEITADWNNVNEYNGLHYEVTYDGSYIRIFIK